MSILQLVLATAFDAVIPPAQPNLIILSADDGPAGTSLQTSSELFFNVEAGATYLVEWCLKSTCNNANGRFAWSADVAIDVGGGANVMYSMSPDTTPSVFGINNKGYETTDLDSTPSEAAETTGTTSTTSTDTQSGVSMFKVGGSAGTFRVRFRALSGASVGVTMRSGSWLRWQKVS